MPAEDRLCTAGAAPDMEGRESGAPEPPAAPEKAPNAPTLARDGGMPELAAAAMRAGPIDTLEPFPAVVPTPEVPPPFRKELGTTPKVVRRAMCDSNGQILGNEVEMPQKYLGRGNVLHFTQL